jgi:hypothetical protein
MNDRVTLSGLIGVREGDANGSTPSTRTTATFHLKVRASGAASFHHTFGTVQRVSFDQRVCVAGLPLRAVYEIEMAYHSFSRRPLAATDCHSKMMTASAPL